MKIGIIGGGSIGLLFSCYLSKHHEVTVYCRTDSQVEQINRHGVNLIKKNEQQNFPIQASVSTALEPADLYIICVKQYHLNNVIPVLQQTDKNAILLFLQNGIGHLPELKKLAHECILVGVVEHGAMKEGNTTVRHTGQGLTRISEYKAIENNVHTVREILSMEEFPFVIEADYMKMLENKLLANAVINPLTAILNIKNGELLFNPFFNQLFQKFFQEVANVLQIVDQQSALQYLETICKNTAENESSMLRDIKLNNRIEIDGIITPLINKAEEKNIQIPLLYAAYETLRGRTGDR